MAGEFGGGFRVGMLGLVAGIARFFGGMPAITAKELLRSIAYLKDQTVALETTHTSIFWKLGGALAGALQTFAVYIRDHAKEFLKWAGDKLRKLEQYLKDKFGPILHYLKVLKDHINDIYKRFVRPIIDTIEFIRQLNRVLNVFHIHVFDKLDATLQQIERRLEAPFEWIQAHITELMNLIDRVMTADGLFQRLTLLKSTWQYNGAIIRQGFNGMIRPLPDFRRGRMLEPPTVLTQQELSDTVRDAALDGEGELGPAVQEFVDQLRIYAHQV